MEDYPEVTRDLKQVLRKVEQHVSDLKELSKRPRQHFADYAHAVILLHKVIPGAVIRFLQEEGLPVRAEVLPEVSRTIAEIWHSQADQAPRTEETAVARNR